MEKFVSISLKLIFTPNSLGCCGLKVTNLGSSSVLTPYLKKEKKTAGLFKTRVSL